MFTATLLIGIIVVYLTAPKVDIVYKFPSPDNAGKVTYRSDTGACCKYAAKKANDIMSRFDNMSKSTPLNQLPPQQPDAHVDRAEQDVLQEIMKTTGEYMPQMMQQPPVLPMQYAQQQNMMMVPNAAMSTEKFLSAFDQGDIKTFYIAALLFVIVSHKKTVSLIAEKIPFFANEPSNMIFRTKVFAAVLAIVMKTINKMA
eukprot:gene19655-26341_t